MNYCIQYSSMFKHFDDERITEVMCHTDGEEVKEMKAFCEAFPDKTIVLHMDAGLDSITVYNILKLYESHQNFKVLIYNKDRIRTFVKGHKNALEQLKEKGIPFFFNSYVSDWDELHMVADLGASDVYVVENLCFELDKVHEFAINRNLKVRVFPNVAQSKYKYDVRSFFIRPEDRELYDEYVDIYEFYRAEAQKNTDNTYFKVYADAAEWRGELDQLIIGLEDELDSRFVVPRFGEFRIKCGKRCLKGHPCKMCDRVKSLAETLETAGLTVRREN